jgi:SAM-dependent methyltransferase
MNPHKVEWTQEKVRDFWRVNHANFSRRRYSRQVGPALARLVNRNVPQGGIILDYGCGNGDLLRVLDPLRNTLLGTDYDAPADFLPYAPSGLGTLFVRGQRYFVAPDEVELLRSSVDAVLLIEVVEHLDDAGLDTVLANSRNVLRRGGIMLVTTPNREDLTYNSANCPDCGCIFHRVQHVRSWTADALVRRLAQHDLSPLRIMETDLGRMQRSLVSRIIRTALDRYDRRMEPHLVGLFRG